LLPPGIIFDIFHDYDMNQLGENTQMTFPLKCEEHDNSLRITIILDLLVHKTMTRRKTILILGSKSVPKIIRIEKMMRDIYDEVQEKFKRVIFDRIGSLK
jgi:hypothetical protein